MSNALLELDNPRRGKTKRSNFPASDSEDALLMNTSQNDYIPETLSIFEVQISTFRVVFIIYDPGYQLHEFFELNSGIKNN